MDTLSDRIHGSLFGAACGDALGVPFEGRHRVDPQQLTAWCAADRPLVYSDDTAMMRVLAHHLGENKGRVEDEQLMLEFARDWRADPNRGYGAGPPGLFVAALEGRDWRAMTRGLFGGTGSLGNGGAMRVAPVAFVASPVADRVALARRQAALTHLHPEALDGAALLCAAISTAADWPGDLDPNLFLGAIAPHVTTATFRERIQLVHAAVRRRLEPAQLGDALGNDVTARGSVPTAIATFLLHPDDPRTAITNAIQAGGDTDTIASMTGALVGARCGLRGLPPPWVLRLEAGPELRRHADRLARLHTRA